MALNSLFSGNSFTERYWFEAVSLLVTIVIVKYVKQWSESKILLLRNNTQRKLIFIKHKVMVIRSRSVNFGGSTCTPKSILYQLYQ